MQKRTIVIFLVAALLIAGSACIFWRKHPVRYQACYRIPGAETTFYPDAYRFLNSEEELLQSIGLIGLDTTYFSRLGLDFERHTYILVFGAPIREMYHSLKTTLFDDKSPGYASARRYGKRCVFIDYDRPDNGLYLYEIDKSPNLTGFNGL